MEKTILFAVTGVLLCLAWQASASCYVSDINRCTGKLKKFLTLHDLNTEHSIMEFDDEHELDTICSDFYEARTCMATVAPHCDKTVKAVWEGEKAGNEYLCTPATRAGLMQHNPCIVNNTKRLESICSVCTTNYKNFMKNHMDPNSYCRETPKYISCCTNPIKEDCGSEAADLQKEYTKRVLNPMSEILGCNRHVPIKSNGFRVNGNSEEISDGSNRDNPFGWLVGSIILLVVLGLCIAVVVASHSLKRNQRKAQSGTFSHGLDAVSRVPYGKLTNESA